MRISDLHKPSVMRIKKRVEQVYGEKFKLQHNGTILHLQHGKLTREQNEYAE